MALDWPAACYTECKASTERDARGGGLGGCCAGSPKSRRSEFSMILNVSVESPSSSLNGVESIVPAEGARAARVTRGG